MTLNYRKVVRPTVIGERASDADLRPTPARAMVVGPTSSPNCLPTDQSTMACGVRGETWRVRVHRNKILVGPVRMLPPPLERLHVG